MAEAGAEHAYSILDDVDNEFESGKYNATSVPPEDESSKVLEYEISSKGTYESATKKVRLIINKIMPPPIDADAAISIYTQGANATAEATAQGSPLIDGNNYEVPSDFICSGSGCASTYENGNSTNGIYVDSGTVEEKGAAQIEPSVQVSNGKYTNEYWLEVASIYKEKYYNVYNSTIEDTNLGTRNDPEINVLESGSTLSGTVNGAGILIIDSDVHCTGNFHFEGQVIILGNSDTVNLFSAGTPYIYGSVVVVGNENPKVSIKGNANILYSQQALSNLSNIDKLKNVISWKDEH